MYIFSSWRNSLDSTWRFFLGIYLVLTFDASSEFKYNVNDFHHEIENKIKMVSFLPNDRKLTKMTAITGNTHNVRLQFKKDIISILRFWFINNKKSLSTCGKKHCYWCTDLA